jgi:SAM-dependent methyltransferase
VSDLELQWQTSAKLLRAHHDLLMDRPAGAHADAVDARGWRDALLALPDEALQRLERGDDVDTPMDALPLGLRALQQQAALVSALPSLLPPLPTKAAPRRHETPRKQQQVDAVAALVAPLARQGARRVVDVGAGHGHLTRSLARALPLPTVGLERDERLAARARALASVDGSDDDDLSFAIADVVQSTAPFASGDCVVGLHACGELGDVIVSRAATSSAAAVVLVGCCLQKRRADARASLCRCDDEAGALTSLPRTVLGLSNLASRAVGVEAGLEENLQARERRLALWLLLQAAGVSVRLGAELFGHNRRLAHQPLSAIVARVFTARALPVPSDDAVAVAAQQARAQHAAQRRLALPRTFLSRVLEVFVLADRALHLERNGYAVAVGAAFSPAVSARNLALVAVRR